MAQKIGAGIYVHIPFCRRACSYCNFHFSTSLKNVDKLTAAILREVELRKSFFGKGERITTVYFGGGTPSVLSSKQILSIWESLNKHFSIASDAEVTLEANPDDLTKPYLSELKSTPVNRLSIGVQSFRDMDLKLMNRSHTSKQAEQSIRHAQNLGFENITIDLIYGIPGMSNADFDKQLQYLKSFAIPHFSAYALTVEPKTALAYQIKKGKVPEPDENALADQFSLLQNFARENNYRHYELSNFCQAGWESRHNSSYWQGAPYLGLGPAAHSYNGTFRSWNVANNQLYLKALQTGTKFMNRERLTEQDRYNEYVMTGLRLDEGFPDNFISSRFSRDIREHYQKERDLLLKSGKVALTEGQVLIPPQWRFHSDGIAADLFYI